MPGWLPVDRWLQIFLYYNNGWHSAKQSHKNQQVLFLRLLSSSLLNRRNFSAKSFSNLPVSSVLWGHHSNSGLTAEDISSATGNHGLLKDSSCGRQPSHLTTDGNVQGSRIAFASLCPARGVIWPNLPGKMKCHTTQCSLEPEKLVCLHLQTFASWDCSDGMVHTHTPFLRSSCGYSETNGYLHFFAAFKLLGTVSAWYCFSC